MEKYKAAILFKQNTKLELELHSILDRKPSLGEIKVKMITSGLCGAQVNEITGKKGEDKFLPHFMGHEGFGEVLDIGEGVAKVKVGDKVILHWRQSNGMSIPGIFCTTDNGLKIGGGPVTTFSEITFVAENRCTKINTLDGLDNVYPLLGCALPTAFGAITKEVNPNFIDKILIFGAGGLGIALLFWCNILGYRDVTVVDIFDEKKQHIINMGGKFINIKEFKSFDNKFNIIFETTGIIENVENCFVVSDKLAKINLIGQTPRNKDVNFKNFLKFYDGMSIIASQGGQFDPDSDMEQILHLLHKNKELALGLVSNVISLKQINEGFQLMKSPSAKRVIIDFSI